jgi:hypothetical protein
MSDAAPFLQRRPKSPAPTRENLIQPRSGRERTRPVLGPDLIELNLWKYLWIESRHHLFGEEVKVPPGLLGVERSVEKSQI